MGALEINDDIADAFWASYNKVSASKDPIGKIEQDLKIFKSTAQQKISEGSPVLETRLKGLIREAERLLDLCKKDPSSEASLYILAGIDYLVAAEDADNDWESYEGFEDDESVLRVIANHFSL